MATTKYTAADGTVTYVSADELTPGVTRFTVSGDGQKTRTFEGRVQESKTCGALCRNSAGPSCTCACGGHNHGKSRWL